MFMGSTFNFLYNVLYYTFEISMLSIYFGRLIPPLLVDVCIVIGGALYFTSLPRPPNKKGTDLFGDKCIAHRGASLDAPENTLAAFKYCVEHGCSQIEFDIRITRDGKCVLAHDDTISGLVIKDTEWEQLEQLQAVQGHPMGEKFGNNNPCLFDDAVDYMVEKRVKMIIDVKDLDPKVNSTIVAAFQRHPDMYDTSMVTSFNPLIVYRIRKLDPQIVGALSYRPMCFSTPVFSPSEVMRKRYPDSILKHCGARILDKIHALAWKTGAMARWPGCSALLIHKDIVNLSVAEQWKSCGYSVAVWTVNQPLAKQYAVRVLGVAYLADTLVGEPTTCEINGRPIKQE